MSPFSFRTIRDGKTHPTWPNSTHEIVGSGLGFKYQTWNGFRSGASFSNTHLEPKPDTIIVKLLKYPNYITLFLNPKPNQSQILISHLSHLSPLSTLKLKPQAFTRTLSTAD